MIRGVFISLVIFSCLAFLACSTGKEIKIVEKEKSTIDYYKEAMGYAISFEESNFLNRDCEMAILNFRKVVSIDKSNADAWFNMGRLFLYKHEYSKARKTLENATRYRRDFVEAYSLLIKTSLMEGNSDYALSIAKKGNEEIPNNDILMNDLAVVYIRMKELSRAKDIAEEIIRRNVKFIPAYITLGNVYYLEKKYELARLIYLKAVDEGGESGELFTNLGIISLHLDDRSAALEMLKKAVSVAPNNPYTHLNLGKFFLSAGDWEGAMSEFKTAIRLRPRMVEAANNAAIAFTKLKLFDEAENLYKKAIGYDPTYAEVYFNYAILLNDYRGESGRALTMFRKFLSLKGKEIKKNHRVYRYIDEIQVKGRKKRKR